MNPTLPVYALPEGVETFWASGENPTGVKGAGGSTFGGRKGRPNVPLKAGESLVLLDTSGRAGIVRRIWMTLSEKWPQVLRSIKIEAWFDGAAKPAIAAPLADFFGHPLGRLATHESAFTASPEGRSLLCTLPMPFRRSAKIVMTNEGDVDIRMVFYDVNFTLGDPPADTYLHAAWRRQHSTVMRQDYEVMQRVTGAGRFLGCNIGVMANTRKYFKAWWGEGEMKFYLDNDTHLPTLVGTGTEDYIGTGWGQGVYSQMYQGCPLADEEKVHYGFYRWHVPDPIYFRQDLRVTIQQIGCWSPDNRKQMYEAGEKVQLMGPDVKYADLSPAGDPREYGLFEREQDDYCSTAYFYLDRPESNLPPLQPLAERVAGIEGKK